MPIGGGRPLVAPFMRDKVPDSDTTLPRTLKCRCHSARAPSPGSAIKIALYPALSQGDAGIFGPCRSPQGAQLPLVFPLLLKGLALASASALLSPCAAKRVQTTLSIPPTTPCLPPVNVAQDRIVRSICELRPVAAWGFVMVNAQFGDRR